MYQVYANGTLIHDLTKYEDSYYLIGGNVKGEVNKAGSFDFTILPSHSFYDQLEQMKTVVYVKKGDVEIFRGRVLQISNDIYKQRKVYCEGNLSYFVDSVMDPVVEEVRSKAAHFRAIIAKHNSQVETWKQFTPGIITVDNADKEETFNTSSYQTCQQALNSLISDYGGYLVPRTVGDVTYLDWLKTYNHTATQPIELTVNMIDFNHERSVDDLYTVFYPTGDDDLKISSENGGSPYLQNDSMVAKYGKIIHHENFSGVDDAKELKRKATEFFEDYLKKDLESFSIKAVDLHFLDKKYDQILLGDTVHIINPSQSIDINRVVTSYSFSLSSPESDSYEFGDTYQSLAEKHLRDSQKSKEKEDALAREQKDMSKTLKLHYERIEFTAEKVDLVANDLALTAHQVEVNAEQIALKASNSDLDALSEDVRSVEIDMDGVKGELSLKATQEQMNIAGTKINELEIGLESARGLITLKADQTVMDSEITNLRGLIGATDTRLRQAEVNIDAQYAQIELKASQESFNALSSNVDAYKEYNDGRVDAVERSYRKASITIDALNNQITSKVEKDGVISTINQNAEEVKIDAAKVDLSAYVTAKQIEATHVTSDQLSAALADIDYGFSEYIRTKRLTVLQSMEVGTLCIGIGDEQVSVAEAIRGAKIESIGNNTYQLYVMPITSGSWKAVEGSTFSRATALSRAWSSGQVTVSASPQGNSLRMAIYDVAASDISWDGNVASFPVYTNLDGNETKYATGKTLKVDATERYNAGVTYGRSTGYAAARLILNTDQNEISIGNTGNLTAVGISSGIGLTYNSTNHKYTATSSAKAGSTTMATNSTVSGTEAYDAGVTAGGNAAGLSVTANNPVITRSASSTTKSVTISASSSIGKFSGESMAYPVTNTVKAGSTTILTSTSYLEPKMSINVEAKSIDFADSGASYVTLALSATNLTFTQTSSGGTLSTTATMKANGTEISKITRSTTLRKTSVKYASALTQWRTYKTALAYYDDDGDRYIPTGYYYWYYSNTSGFADVYIYSID